MAGRENDGKATTEEALAYVHVVKNTLQNEPEKYEEFLEVMKNFRASRIDTNGVVTRLKEVFKDHEELILGLARFLSFVHNIPNMEQEKKHLTIQDALSLVNKVKTRFQGDNVHVYKSFLDILKMSRNGSKSVPDVYHEVGILFKDHPDLLAEFHCFLPPSFQTIVRDQGIAMLFQSLNI